MIKANELRIGNYITDDDGCLAKINGFTSFDHSIRCDEAEGCILLIDVFHELTSKWKMGREADSPECNPIPLNREWLEKLGYKYYPDEKKYYKSPHNLPPIYNWRTGDYGMEGLPLSAKSFQFVHQLQNLYFALTGEELTINNEHLQSAS